MSPFHPENDNVLNALTMSPKDIVTPEEALAQRQQPKNTLGAGIADMYARDRAEKLDKGLRIRREDNAVVINGIIRLSIKAGDNIMILEDEFKSSYDCKECKGAGLIPKTCLKCEGTGSLNNGSNDTKDKCGKCEGKGTWNEKCPACNGKGTLVEIPNSSRKKPTSGTIVSCGPTCKIYEVGQRVCYSSFTGHFLPFNANDRLKIMREEETMCLIEDIDPTNPSLDQLEFSSSDNPYDGIVENQ